LENFELAELDHTRPYLQHYYHWMKEHMADFTAADATASERLRSILSDEVALATLCKKASAGSASGRGVVEIGKYLTKILRGEKDPLELIFRSNVAENYYQEANKRIESSLQGIMELIAFKTPGLKILEIGAGTGSTTSLVLKYARIKDKDNESFSAVSSYEFTDISASFFAAAKENFRDHSDKMEYSVLDCSKDPVSQGFKEGHYDLIVAANVLHATPDLNITISNARRLLIPGGKLVLLEITENQWIPQIIFGTLPGWWLSNDQYREPGAGPCISSAAWDQVFKRTGFSGTDIVAHDARDPRSRICSVMVATAVEERAETWPETVILAEATDDSASAAAAMVQDALSAQFSNSVSILSLVDAKDYDFSDKFCISLLEITKPTLVSVDEEQFTILRHVLTRVSQVLWVHSSLDSTPEFNLVEGLFRVLRSENAQITYVTLATQSNTTIPTTARYVVKVAKATVGQELERAETEYKEVDGTLSVCRAVPATTINRHIEQSVECAAQYLLPNGAIDAPTMLDPNATYVVAGGFGGLARRICRWTVERGARNLVLLSRSGPKSTAAQELLCELRLQGVRVECPACDISSTADLQHALEDSLTRLPPVKGCIQGALVLQDSIFERRTHKQWTTTLSPRISGTQNLFSLLPNLSFFIILSSVNGVIGNPSQGNYAATNTYLDAFAHHHSTPTCPVIAIDVGWVDFAGTVAESEEIQKRLASLGCLTPLSETEMLGLLEYYCDPGRLAQGVPPQTVMGIKRSEVAGRNLLDRPLWSTLRLLEDKDSNKSTTTTSDTQSNVSTSTLLSSAANVSEASRIVLEALTTKLATDLGLEEDAIRADKPLHDNGVDSLMAVQLRGWFRSEIGANVTVFDIMGNLGLESVCRRAAEKSSWVVLGN
jgi:SAM-dependent methyltransferase/NAD(P)-dependent dehydrogenase (short-subunit alcohol dehydrogenase family)/aryl carrier-like protein